MYIAWNKSKSHLPVIYYDFQDFGDYNQRVALEGLILTYGIGAVYLSDGNYEAVREWIQNIQHVAETPPLFVAKAKGVFELPFGQLESLPDDEVVECLRDNVMVKQLAENNASLLHGMGVGLLHFDRFPSYYGDAEAGKVLQYLQTLQDRGIHLSFGNDCAEFIGKYQDEINWTKVDWLESRAIADEALTKKKLRRRFLRETDFDGLIIETFEMGSLLDSKKNQWVLGMSALVVNEHMSSHQILNQLLDSEVMKKSYFKEAVKRYYDRWHQLESIQPVIEPFSEKLFAKLAYQFTTATVTLVKDDKDYFPIRDLRSNQFYSFSSSRNKKEFYHMTDLYKSSHKMDLSQLLLPVDSLLRLFPAKSNLLVDLSSVIHLRDIQVYLERLLLLEDYHQVGVLYQGAQSNIRYLDQLSTLMWSPDMSMATMNVMVQMVFGAMDIKGQLPSYLTLSGKRLGVPRESLRRLSYIDPSLLGVDVSKLAMIDSLVVYDIREQSFPGCQILMVKNGAVVYSKTFGYLTYDSLEEVKWDYLYDIASVTKTTVTVPVIMNEVAHGGLDLNGRLGDYSDRYRVSDKSNLRLTDLLSHQAGLKSYIPFWQHASYIADSADFFYKKSLKRNKYEYSKINWSDSISTWIGQSSFNSLKNSDSTYRYLYSDLGFMIMKDIVEEREKITIDHLVDSLVFAPLSMDHTLYNPLRFFPESQIAPTELDGSFRNSLLRGQVHDRNAALLGGVSGHAGLFSNSNDLAKYMEMMLQQGYYGGQQVFDSVLVQTFTEINNVKYSRALGWDKPRRSVGNTSKYASDQAFGHTGFTGTSVWADPEYDMVYIFLSNRIYPDPQNYKLIRNNTRTKIHDLMYESILSEDKVVNHEM
ncbi:serine hydrolase [Reichenbachiella agarivorans]|uniref:Serine hydrolase n=1 Tax=Reichenbachiella agarivorans TaxID=2979464 RepID=A0ABY6CPF2_9BACT|nr:serine hydrolase [Reichenbachiella agarivorans]UXP32390.1 serine hydrolase [Reichenbachiella agarivorans]